MGRAREDYIAALEVAPARLRQLASLLLLLAVGCLGPYKQAYQQLDRIVESVPLPSTLHLVYRDNEGTFSPIDDSGPPSQLRVYRVRGDPLRARAEVIEALAGLGLDRRVNPLSYRHREDNATCVFTMAGDGLVFNASLEPRPDQPYGSGPTCPRRNWGNEVFLWLRLDVAWARFT